MFFTIDFSNDLALYDQIIRQIKFAVAGEVLKPGEMIPSVRELARELTINPNTVARAYRQLQSDGILASVRGTGLLVADSAFERCRQDRQELIRARLRQVLAEAQQSRLDAEEILALVQKEWNALQDGESRVNDDSMTKHE